MLQALLQPAGQQHARQSNVQESAKAPSIALKTFAPLKPATGGPVPKQTLDHQLSDSDDGFEDV